jgi:hypothetical protein
MKFARFEAVVIASTILASAAYAQHTGTIESDDPPLAASSVSPAVALATTQSMVCAASWSKTMERGTARIKLENCSRQD